MSFVKSLGKFTSDNVKHCMKEQQRGQNNGRDLFWPRPSLAGVNKTRERVVTGRHWEQGSGRRAQAVLQKWRGKSSQGLSLSGGWGSEPGGSVQVQGPTSHAFCFESPAHNFASFYFLSLCVLWDCGCVICVWSPRRERRWFSTNVIFFFAEGFETQRGRVSSRFAFLPRAKKIQTVACWRRDTAPQTQNPKPESSTLPEKKTNRHHEPERQRGPRASEFPTLTSLPGRPWELRKTVPHTCRASSGAALHTLVWTLLHLRVFLLATPTPSGSSRCGPSWRLLCPLSGPLWISAVFGSCGQDDLFLVLSSPWPLRTPLVVTGQPHVATTHAWFEPFLSCFSPFIAPHQTPPPSFTD